MHTHTKQIGKWVNKYIYCFMSCRIQHIIPSLTEYIPVFPAKGLDDGGERGTNYVKLK